MISLMRDIKGVLQQKAGFPDCDLTLAPKFWHSLNFILDQSSKPVINARELSGSRLDLKVR